ncbi:hypothetical protein F5B19DRAFT_448026 [Rostrohypoxylon terebratum]|nr:hypothetical protein F5B19DRAFT_448026 [Rostrohypoxylon terebratum]
MQVFIVVAIFLGLVYGAVVDIVGACNVATNVCYANVDNSEQASCSSKAPCTDNAKACTIQIVAPIGFPERGKATCS